MSKKSQIFNWLLLNDKLTTTENDQNSQEKRNSKKACKKSQKEKIKYSEVEEKELIRSPVSGTYILKEWKKPKTKQTYFSKSEINLNSIAASFVEITPQSRAKLAKIPNKIGPYECKLCKVIYKDAFELAMHNCPRVVHIEYKCSECDKIFNCPANLASHKRWHKPKQQQEAKEENKKKEKSPSKKETFSSTNEISNNSQIQTNSFYDQFYNYQPYANSFMNSQNEWIKHLYSSYFTAATQSILNGVSIGLPVPLPGTSLRFNSSNTNNFN